MDLSSFGYWWDHYFSLQGYTPHIHPSFSWYLVLSVLKIWAGEQLLWASVGKSCHLSSTCFQSMQRGCRRTRCGDGVSSVGVGHRRPLPWQSAIYLSSGESIFRIRRVRFPSQPIFLTCSPLCKSLISLFLPQHNFRIGGDTEHQPRWLKGISANAPTWLRMAYKLANVGQVAIFSGLLTYWTLEGLIEYSSFNSGYPDCVNTPQT